MLKLRKRAMERVEPHVYCLIWRYPRILPHQPKLQQADIFLSAFQWQRMRLTCHVSIPVTYQPLLPGLPAFAFYTVSLWILNCHILDQLTYFTTPSSLLQMSPTSSSKVTYPSPKACQVPEVKAAHKLQLIVPIFTDRPHIEDVTNMCHASMAHKQPATAFGRNYNV